MMFLHSARTIKWCFIYYARLSVAQSRLAVVQEGIPEEYMAESWQLSQPFFVFRQVPPLLATVPEIRTARAKCTD